MSLTIVVPGLPPSVNHAFVQHRQGGRGLKDEAKEYQEWARLAALEAAQGWKWNGSWLRLAFKWYVPDSRMRDSSNVVKVLEDGIAQGIGVNDRWFLWCIDVPELDRTNPRSVVTVSALIG